MTVEIAIGIGSGAIIGQVSYQLVLKMAQIVLAKGSIPMPAKIRVVGAEKLPDLTDVGFPAHTTNLHATGCSLAKRLEKEPGVRW